MSIIGSFAQHTAAALRCALDRTAFILGAAGWITAGAFSTADAQSTPASNVPKSAFFMGLGGSYNSANFGTQNVFAQGDSAIFLDDVLVAVGSAGGPANPLMDTQSTLAPVAQLGYFQHFANSKWLWGAKFSYSYLDATSAKDNVVVPQVGSFTSSTPDTFTGNVVIGSYRASINHQMALMPFIGHSFEKSFIYLGAGLSLSQAQTKLANVIGFAAINGTHVNITGTPASFSSSPWVLGGAAVIGGTYFFAPSWFLDFSYRYDMTQNRKSNFAGPFMSTTDGYDDIGILSGNYSGRVITQALTVSINNAF